MHKDMVIIIKEMFAMPLTTEDTIMVREMRTGMTEDIIIHATTHTAIITHQDQDLITRVTEDITMLRLQDLVL